MFLIFGGWHLRFHMIKAQGTKYSFNNNWPQEKHRRFFSTTKSTTTCFIVLLQVALYGPLTSNHYVGVCKQFDTLSIVEVAHSWFIVLFLVIPIFRDAHFYLVHRLLHFKFLYKHVHALHHKNIDIGPWSGLAMHPIEHLLYFSGVLIHWIILSHPLHAILHIQATGLTPALGHLGFDKYLFRGKTPLTLGQRYFHYLHHKYFECNYGGDGTVPMDKWFGSFHDGTEEGHELMKQRRKKTHGLI